MTNTATVPSRLAPERSVDDPFGDDPFAGLPGLTTAEGIRSRFTIASNLVLRRRKPRLAYAAVVIVGVLAIVVTQLLLSVGLSNGAYQIESLQSKQTQLDRSNGSLHEKLDTVSSPQNLAASAQSLGMVTNANPVYLRLSDGAVLGTPKAASGSASAFTGGTSSLIPPAAVQGATPATPAAAAASGATATGATTTAGETTPGATTPSAPAATDSTPTLAWSGDLPSPTTH